MALADLLTALDRDAEAEIRAIRAAGDAEVAQIDAGASRARGDREAVATAAIRAERGAEAGERLAAASHRARAEVLAARGAMLDRLRAAVADRLPAVVAGDPRLAARLIDAALACTGEAAGTRAGSIVGTLRCAPALVEAARAAAPPAIRVEPDPAVTTGAVIELATGTRIEATLGALLDREWAGLACEALALERAR